MDEDIKQLIKAFARVYSEIKNTIDETMPDPREVLLKYLYDLKQEPLSLEEMVEELRKAGHKDIVEKIIRKQPKKMIGFLYWYGYEGEAVYKAFEKTKKLSVPPEIRIEDFSTDVMSIADMIADFQPEKVIVFTLKKRGRTPGIYRYKKRIKRAEGLEAVERIRPSMEGLLDIDALLEGLGVFSKIEEIEIVECEPETEKLEECSNMLFREALREIKVEE
ncbi:MAG: hypothetical protein DRJ35_02070 [Thermoprotei archaeon]|nr:MAG: hypothetical protein DRJ35_02070 [Thermoprotei archaeon]